MKTKTSHKDDICWDTIVTTKDSMNRLFCATTKLKAVAGYCDNVSLLCKIVDDGNGLDVTFKSYNSEGDKFIRLDYANAEELRLCLNNIDKHNKRTLKGE